ncbi:uncharacterized protein L203_101494 [Cryptococcus depauperatus CBS 7841]|uniref:Uncharacterized protein n=1 Tax=Cryptococcus depauperatus CBS 7841 TaxID=1295531 RepID=A0AAJ8JQ14_9TREE
MAVDEMTVSLETPGAGPSKSSPVMDNFYLQELEMDEQNEDIDLLRKKNEYLELQQSVDSSNELLSSLASYLSTFQKDLSAVSGQITELQGKSSIIDSRLNGRKAVIPALNSLLREITLPPSLVLTLRDTLPSQNPDLWLTAIQQLDEKIACIQARGKVKAVHEIRSILDGFRIKTLNVLPPFLLSLIRPLKSASKGLSTNLAVLQTSILLKYQPFYSFLQRQSPRIAKQVERGYVDAARAYYETGMRRYTRSLTQIRQRTVDKVDPIGYVAAESMSSGPEEEIRRVYERLEFANLEEGGVILSFNADDKEYRSPVEALFRSLGLVLIDNASAEFTFIVRFFTRVSLLEKVHSPQSTPLESPSPSFVDLTSEIGHGTARNRNISSESDERLKEAERIWHEVFDSALEYTTSFFQSMVYTPPPTVSLLTIIRLNDRLLTTCDSRGCLPLTSYLSGWKLTLWPIFRKKMDQHIESLKKLADEAEGKGLAGLIGKGVKDRQVKIVAARYAGLYGSVTALSEETDEVMLFSSMARLRSELVRLAQTQSNKIKYLPERHSFLSSIYEIILHELASGPVQAMHPRIQSELSLFKTREEEARRKISNSP